MTEIAEFWPPYALEIACGDLTLAPVRDEDIGELADLAHGGVTDEGVEAFPFAWDRGDRETVGRNLATYHWRVRAASAPNDWTVEFAVRVGGELLGVQALRAKDYGVLRTASSGSWLARGAHGHGIGTRMRSVLATAMFDEFGAEELVSEVEMHNSASIRVSEKVGYVQDGTLTALGSRGQRISMRRFVLTAKALVRPHETVTVTGAERFRAFIGLKNEEE